MKDGTPKTSAQPGKEKNVTNLPDKPADWGFLAKMAPKQEPAATSQSTTAAKLQGK